MSELNELNIKVDRKNISLVVKEVAAFCGKYTVKVSPDITDGVLIVHGRVNSDNRDIYNGLKDWEDRERWQDENDIYAFCNIENGEGTLDLGVAKLGKAMAGKDLGETMYVGVSVFADGALVGLGDMEVMVTNAYEQDLKDQELIMFKGKDGKDFVISKVSATFSANNTFFTTLVKLDDGTHLLTFYMPKGMLTGPKGDPGSLETTGEVVMKTIQVLESDHYYIRPCNLSLRGELSSYDANVDINPSAAEVVNNIEDEFYRNTISQSSGVMTIGTRNKAIGTESSILIGSENELKGEGSNIAAGYGNKVDGRTSVAIGYESEAKGHMSIALGYKCKALTSGSIAMGYQTEASTGLDFTEGGSGAHAEGHQTKALNLYAHAEGSGTKASGYGSHAEGIGTEASGSYAHAEGNETAASGAHSHAEGGGTVATGKCSHAEGETTEAYAGYSHAEGKKTKTYGSNSHAEGDTTRTVGDYSHAEGFKTYTGVIQEGADIKGDYSHAEGKETVSAGSCSHAEGEETRTNGESSHAEGKKTRTNGMSSHAEGKSTTTEGEASHAEGELAVSSGKGSHAEGSNTKSIGAHSHSEGKETQAIGSHSHAEGASTSASGAGSHAEGQETEASGEYSHASGCRSKAIGNYSMAHGLECQAGDNSGDDHTVAEHSIALGNRAIAEEDFAFVFRGSNDKGVPNGSNGAGTFNLHLKNGIDDIYVNDKKLSELVAQKGDGDSDVEPEKSNPFVELKVLDQTESCIELGCTGDSPVKGNRFYTPQYSSKVGHTGEWDSDFLKIGNYYYPYLNEINIVGGGHIEASLDIKTPGKATPEDWMDASWLASCEFPFLSPSDFSVIVNIIVEVHQGTKEVDGVRVWDDRVYISASDGNISADPIEIPIAKFTPFDYDKGEYGTIEGYERFKDDTFSGGNAAMGNGISFITQTMIYDGSYTIGLDAMADVMYISESFNSVSMGFKLEKVAPEEGEDERYKAYHKEYWIPDSEFVFTDHGATLVRKGTEWFLTVPQLEFGWLVYYDYMSHRNASLSCSSRCYLSGEFQAYRSEMEEEGMEFLPPFQDWGVSYIDVEENMSGVVSYTKTVSSMASDEMLTRSYSVSWLTDMFINLPRPQDGILDCTVEVEGSTDLEDGILLSVLFSCDGCEFISDEYVDSVSKPYEITVDSLKSFTIKEVKRNLVAVIPHQKEA
jgi:hypothetical protein